MHTWQKYCFAYVSSRNSSTKDLTQFAAEAIAFNRQLSQHDEQQEDAGAIVCTMRLSPPSNSRLARRRAQSSALRSREFRPTADNLAAWRTGCPVYCFLIDFGSVFVRVCACFCRKPCRISCSLSKVTQLFLVMKLFPMASNLITRAEFGHWGNG